MSHSSEENHVFTGKWQQNFHHLRDQIEKVFEAEDEALSKFDAQWKHLKREYDPSEAPKNDLYKQPEKQLQKMGGEPETGSNEPATEPGSLILNSSTAYYSKDMITKGPEIPIVSPLVPSQPGQEPVTLPTEGTNQETFATGTGQVLLRAEGNGENTILVTNPTQTSDKASVQDISIPTAVIFEPNTPPKQATDTYGQKVLEQAASNARQTTQEDRVLLQLSSAKKLLQLQAQPYGGSNVAEQAKQTLRAWISRDLETFSPEENLRELKEALEVLHAQNQLPKELLNRLHIWLNDLGVNLARYFKEKEELNNWRKFLSDHEQDLAKMKHGVQICQTCEVELDEYDSKIARVKAELAALEQGRAGVIEKIQGVMGSVEPIKRKLELYSSQADQVRVKRFRLEFNVDAFNGHWLAIRKSVNNYFNF